MPPFADHPGHVALGFGHFYGYEDVHRSDPGLALSLMRADPHRVVERHTHEEAHFVLVLDGLYVSTADGAPPVSAGTQLIFNPAGTTHRDRFEARDRKVEGRFLTISVAPQIMAEAQMAGAVTTRAVVIRHPETVAKASRLAQGCIRECSDASITRVSLMLDLVRHVAAVKAEPHRDAPAWLTRVKEYLDDALGAPVRIADIASAVDVHPVHLSRVFRQHLGVNPAEYLRSRRLEKAQRLLQHSAKSLTDISDSCGFSHQSHFTNAFRRHYGVAPAQYRTQQRR